VNPTPAPNTPARHVAVIGGGVTGLAAAYRLRECSPQTQVTLFERSDRLGGAILTCRRDGFLIDRGPDNFITQLPYATDLCRRLGLADDLLPTDAGHRKAFVVRKGRLLEIPEGFVLMAPSRVWPVLATPILSFRAKLRLACEPLIPRRRDESDESFADFVSRRLGRETYDRLVQPLISSIYTADATTLSVEATMPQFAAMERKHGSLVFGARKMAAARKAAAASQAPQSGDGAAARQASGARYSMFVAPRDGMGMVVEELAGRIGRENIRTGTPVTRLRKSSGGWLLTLVAGGEEDTQRFDAVILACPAFAAADLLRDTDADLADRLGAIEYASSAVVSLAYRREDIAHPLDGFGFVVPITEGRNILAGSFSSVKYPGRAPGGQTLLRVFVGGALQGHLLDRDDDALIELTRGELSELLGVSGEPTLAEITRWNRSMPQYHVGHLDRVAEIEKRVAALPGLALAGAGYRGVGVPQCVRSAQQAAETILAAAPRRGDDGTNPRGAENAAR